MDHFPQTATKMTERTENQGHMLYDIYVCVNCARISLVLDHHQISQSADQKLTERTKNEEYTYRKGLPLTV